MIQLLTIVFQVILFFSQVWKEGNSEKAKEKSALGKDLVDAMSETDPEKRISRITNVLNDIERVRKKS